VEPKQKQKTFPTWVWFVAGGIAIYFASVVGKQLHPESAVPPPIPYQSTPAANAYLCDLPSYRQHTIQDAEDEAEENGDKFDVEAARKRVLAMSSDELDKQRREDLSFTRKTLRGAGYPDNICPNN
jgi:hypothetical protein